MQPSLLSIQFQWKRWDYGNWRKCRKSMGESGDKHPLLKKEVLTMAYEGYSKMIDEGLIEEGNH